MENRERPNGWKQGLLKDLCVKIGSGSTPRGGSEVYQKEGISLIRSQNILDYAFSYDGLAFINDEQAKKLSNVEIEKEDVLINITGDSVARVCMVPSVTLPARVNQHVAILRVNKKILNPYYLKYYLLNPNFKKHLLLLANSGGTRNALTKLSLENLEILHSSYEEQVAIGQVLSSLDEKIELLEEENKTLETLAQTIFTEWFVNFNFPGATGEMEDSELGEIPKGWRVGKLGEIVDIFDSLRKPISSNKRAERQGQYPYYGATKIMDYIDDYIFDGIYLLFAEDGSVMDEEGYPILQYVWGKFWANNHTHILQGKNNFSTELLYIMFKQIKINSIVTGAVQLKINQGNLLNFKIIIPDDESLKEYNKIVLPSFDKIKNNFEQIQTLKATRDTLLPKLTTGEIRVEGFGE